MRRLLAGALLAVLVTGTLTGCFGASSAGSTASTTAPAAGPGGVGGMGGLVQDSANAAGRLPEATMKVVDSGDFASPTGNIVCHAEKTSIRCDVRQKLWTPTVAKPATCSGTWGGGVQIVSGTAGYTCASDALAGGAPLAYGHGLTVGDSSCVSWQTGILCQNGRTAHGFQISKETHVLY